MEIFKEQDLKQIEEHGLSLEKVYEQQKSLQKGLPFPKLNRPCQVKDGITVIPNEKFEDFRQLFQGARDDGRVLKFVPASGAASRMFKFLVEGLKKPEDQWAQDPKLMQFVEGIRQFAFYDQLKDVCKQQEKDLEELIDQKKYHKIVQLMLSEEGLNFLNSPKGLIPFHVYPEGAKTAFEEHLTEASVYAVNIDQKVKVHFTVSSEHQKEIESCLSKAQEKLSGQGFQCEINYSDQKSSTDTLALDLENQPFRDQKGELVFRPGGHGALIENLNDLKGDVVFIKNIDNIVPDRLKEQTYLYKELLGGYLIFLQDRIHYYLGRLEMKTVSEELLEEAFAFVRERLWVQPSEKMQKASAEDKKAYLVSILYRPLRVCGMVKNEGEPGGGPFWIEHADGAMSVQIIESAQVDMNSKEQEKVWQSSTHFNPVDLVCALRDHHGKSFDLLKFVDPQMGIVTQKSKEGRALKALELPGLWNGAMASWNTAFVEVPIETFNPVKTVLDLLREQHQPK